MTNMQFLQGNEACTLAGIAAGARFFAGYPISPATEIAELSAKLLPRHDGIYIQMEDEIASIAAVIGASLGGMKAFTATSGPGFSLMQENIGFAVMAEVPCVIINVQRFGPSTGIATQPGQGDIMTARWGTHSDHSIVALAPASVQECFDLTVEAFNLAERFRTPVIVLTDATIAHLRETVSIPDTVKTVQRARPSGPVENYRPYAPAANQVPVMPNYGDDYILRVTGLVHDEAGYSSADPEVAGTLVNRLINKIEKYTDELPEPEYAGPDRPETVIISYGISARAALSAARRAKQQGRSMGVIRLRTIWPFPEKFITDICRSAARVLVVEMNKGQLLREVRAAGITEAYGLNRTDTRVIMPEEILEGGVLLE
ncbi:2-oxoacid:acceptor oxidoreductase subunit alpha [Desulfoscipio geothermicus]|uniref:2-oxoglutarate ferredoxin oxidoreductase, alpha subunit n=1 Tax=Desulfoscipio geothermicus DSM 3669 TaxID=1121426 RepID=A0A1I6D4I2_9FIRM|nr:2-oxoacid:acceptor oxidoreductase subunit alpha [Desulfoscipio geothermicus]SFR00310.1 2-oxoglutarate ferredoxin oxidoreductase, alpha subunit [Desulfoscipio geothermicus DSM 3669]